MPLEEGAVPYPISTDSMNCPKCSQRMDLTQLRRHIELQSGGGRWSRMASERFRILFDHMDKEIRSNAELRLNNLEDMMIQDER